MKFPQSAVTMKNFSALGGLFLVVLFPCGRRHLAV